MDRSERLIPDREESRGLKRYYFHISWIIILLIFVFGVLSSLMLDICSAIIGGGFDSASVEAGKSVIKNDPVMRAVYSYAFPIAADIAALGAGLFITRMDIRRRLSFSGFTGKQVLSAAALSFGTAPIGSFVTLLILLLVRLISGSYDGISVEDASALSIVSDQNPLWLDMLIYLYVCLIGPVLEELVFRGVLLEALRKYGNAFGIIASALLFGLMHRNFMQCIPAMLMGVIWAVIAIKSGSLIPSIFIHILNNSLSAVLMIMMQNSDLSLAASDPVGFAFQALPLISAMAINVLLRFICFIASIVIAARFIAAKTPLVEKSEYCRRRTWKYFFTSIPWLLAMAYMLYGTVTSMPV